MDQVHAERVDNYKRARAKLRNADKAVAMARLWEMGKEALMVRARIGCKTLSYSTDLLPGVGETTVTAHEHGVHFELEHVDWGRDEPNQRELIVDEAWLLGIATPAVGE